MYIWKNTEDNNKVTSENKDNPKDNEIGTVNCTTCNTTTLNADNNDPNKRNNPKSNGDFDMKFVCITFCFLFVEIIIDYFGGW